MKRVIGAIMLSMVFLIACNKKEPTAEERTGAAAAIPVSLCAKEIITDQPVKVGETGIMLPAGSKLCFTADNREIRVELPKGFAFMAKGMNKTLPMPITGTYTCICSAAGTACQVFYADGLGFGCLQSSCSGSCTGKFTYRGYTVDRVIENKSDFFNQPEVQTEIAAISTSEPYSRQTLYGVSFYIVNNEKPFLDAAKCDCEGTQACKMKWIMIGTKKIYYCDGTCNGCELTV